MAGDMLQSTAANLRPSLAIMADAALNPSFPATVM